MQSIKSRIPTGEDPLKIRLLVEEEKIIAQYTVPLISHTDRLEVLYDKKTKELNLQGQFLGQPRDLIFEILNG